VLDFYKWGVSIHAPNEGSDFAFPVGIGICCVSIHAPNEGSDEGIFYFGGLPMFQSTLPMKGATISSNKTNAMMIVSIHAPNEGSDLLISFRRYAWVFQSTLPMKGATRIHERLD